MPQDEYTISGFEVVSRTVKPHGNGARVLVPRQWIGEDATVIRRTKQDETASVEPIAAMMYDAVAVDDSSLREAMQKIVRFQSFQDIDGEVVAVFRACLDSKEDERDELSDAAVETDNAVYSEFFAAISEATSKNALKLVLQDWIQE